MNSFKYSQVFNAEDKKNPLFSYVKYFCQNCYRLIGKFQKLFSTWEYFIFILSANVYIQTSQQVKTILDFKVTSNIRLKLYNYICLKVKPNSVRIYVWCFQPNVLQAVLFCTLYLFFALHPVFIFCIEGLTSNSKVFVWGANSSKHERTNENGIY